MKKSLLILLAILLFLPIAFAAEQLDAQQTAGGDTYNFYYGDDVTNNQNDFARWGKQSFVVGVEQVTKVQLRLKKMSSTWDPCDSFGLSKDKFDVELRDSSGSTVASKYGIQICNLPTSYSWYEIKFDNPANVNLGDTYQIVVVYYGRAFKSSPNMAWDKATYDAYSGGRSEFGNWISSDKDFTFKVYGNAQICTAAWVCKDSATKQYRNTDCTYSQVTSCGSGNVCENGNCVSNGPDMSISSVYMMNTSNVQKTTFKTNEDAFFYIMAQNNWKTGTATYKWELLKNSNVIDTYSSGFNVNSGSALASWYIKKIPSDWSGTYTFKGTVSPCTGSNVCTKSITFTIDSAPTTPNINIVSTDTLDNSLAPKSTFQAGENINYAYCITNTGATGNYNLVIDIFQGTTNVFSTTNSGSITTGSGPCLAALETVGSTWSGQYKYRATASPCASPNTCTKEMFFTVNAAPVCVDNDKDSYGTNCAAGLDCNDSNAAVHSTLSCKYNGNACGTYSLCTASCPTPPTEVLCDGIDNDCNSATSDTACGTGKTCNFTTKQCVTVTNCVDNDKDGYGTGCSLGLDCNDNNAAVHLTLSCNYNGNACGNYSMCATACPTAPTETCDYIDNDCDLKVDEDFDFNTDPNNCGLCGVKCNTNQICSNKLCIYDFTNLSDDSFVMVDPLIFYNISDGLIAKKQVNQVFFKNESEDDAELMLENIIQGLKTVSTLKDVIKYPIMQMKDYKWALQTTTTINIEETEIFYAEATSDSVAFVHLKSTTFEVEQVTEAIKEVDYTVKNLKSNVDLGFKVLSAGLSLWYGIEHSNGDIGRVVIYGGTHYLYYLHPFMGGMSLVKFGKDIVFGVVGIDPKNITCDLGAVQCGFWLVNGVIDTMTNESMVTNALEGQCALLDGRFFSCANNLYWAFSSPFAFVDSMDYKIVNDKPQFNMTVTNYWKYISGYVYVGVTVMDENNNTLCNLPWQKVYFLPGERKQLSFDSCPMAVEKNKKYQAIAKVWHLCYTGCEQASGCYKDGCCTQDTFLGSYEIDFSLANQLPIINNVVCDSLNILGVTCPADFGPIYAGDKLQMTLYANDLDSDKLDAFSAGSFGMIKSCTTDFPWYDTICNFTWQTNALSVGDQWIRLGVSDGYNTTDQLYKLKVVGNKPIISSPKEGDITNTQNPTFKWTAIASKQPVKYRINVYKDTNTNLVYSKDLADPDPSNPNKEYTLNDIDLQKDKNHWVEIVGINNYGIELASNKVKFFVDCYTDTQCGDTITGNGYYCSNGDVVRGDTVFMCNNPGSLNSFCSNRTQEVLIKTCDYKCADGKCADATGCMNNDPACPSDKECVNNACVLKSGCDYNNPGCNANENCVNNACVAKSGCNYNNPSCGTGELCMNNACVKPACSADIDCGTEASNGTYCIGNDVYETKNIPVCNNAGLTTSSCRFSEVNNYKETCGFICNEGACVPLPKIRIPKQLPKLVPYEPKPIGS